MNSQQDWPLISVYMPTFNRLAMATRAIDSVLAQDYPNFELLVVDDSSTDDTWPSLTNKYVNDDRVRFFRQPEGKGACAARNRAINEAKGEFVTGIDDDDEFLPHRLSSLYKAYDPQYSCVCSGYIWDYGSVRKTLFARDEVVTLSSLLDLHTLSNQALVERDRMLQLQGFDEGLAAFQDYDMWVRVVAAFGPARRISDASYKVNVGHELGRITNSPKRLDAHKQFVAKHRPLMSERNLQNQMFYRLMMEKRPLGLFELLRQCRFGLQKLKWRYYFKQKMAWLSSMRIRLFSKGLAGLFKK
ncbi:Glycosyltransferase involved in cell wall bisynthesis [Arsukibacterium tuosuense]|uniref:Glycosyltransferase involved in cell wall bisynthesis n=1 Tax=Arsukibacterium tuosuense TaxID=1323745 RepID=A0A285I8S6_9GAMM|nr:glycosyltransferase [Arsukibacterium tuosuense]SNY44375.1 Glycosyltransferase involved in cell wall bisynthesis [Arsukibacterium tuosuense]